MQAKNKKLIFEENEELALRLKASKKAKSASDEIAKLKIALKENQQLKLTSDEILAIEEYKLAILEACRTAICDSSTASFKLRKKTYAVVAPLKEFFPTRLRLIQDPIARKESRDVTLAQLKEEFHVVHTEECTRKENGRFFNKIKNLLGKLHLLDLPPPKVTPEESSEQSEKISLALKTYKNEILNIPLYQYSGLTKSHVRAETRKSAWKKLLKRISFTLPVLLQTLVYGIFNYVELMGGQSVLMLVPGVTFPIALGISMGLIVISSIIELAFGLKMFKETYGFSYLGRSTKTYLQASETELALTKDINHLLLDRHGMQKMDSETYQQFVTISHLANKDIKRKVANADSPFSMFKETPLRFVVRLSLLAVNAFMALAGAYFMGWNLIALIPEAAFLALGLGPVGILVVSCIIVAVLMVISAALIYFQYKGAIFDLINPTAGRFDKIKEEGVDLVKAINQNEANLSLTATDKKALEQAELLKPLRLVSKSEEASTEEKTPESAIVSSRPRSGSIALTLLGGGKSIESDGSLTDSTDSLESESPKISPRAAGTGKLD